MWQKIDSLALISPQKNPPRYLIDYFQPDSSCYRSVSACFVIAGVAIKLVAACFLVSYMSSF